MSHCGKQEIKGKKEYVELPAYHPHSRFPIFLQDLGDLVTGIYKSAHVERKREKIDYAFSHCALSNLTAAGTVSSRLPSVPHSKLT